MAANVIGHATLNVVPSTKGFGSALKGQIDPQGAAAGTSSGSKLGGAFKAAIGPLMAAAGAVGMGMFVASSVKAAGALEQSMGAIDSVFKSNSGVMHAWASGAASSVGLTRNEFNELGTLIGSQLKNAGTAMSDLGPKTNELIGLGADLASMFGGTSKEAVEAISSALKGERDPIEKYGVSLKQTTIDAKAAELGFQKVGGALSAEANAAATLALIMEQTTDAHGNFAKESSTYEGTMQRLSASWGNITATIGQGFLPIATAVGSVLLGMMPTIQGWADKFASLAPAVQGVTEILLKGNFDGGLFAAFKVAEDSTFVDFLFDVREGVMALFTSGDPSGLANLFVGLIEGAADARNGLITTLAELIPSILQTILGMAPAILGAAVSSFTSLVSALITVVPSLLTAILGMLPSIITTLLGMVPVLITAALQLFTGLVQAVIAVIPLVVTSIVTMLPGIAAALLGMLPAIVESGLSLFMGIVQAVIEMLPVLITTVLDLLPVLITTIVGMLPGILSAGIELFLGLVMAVVQMLPQLIVTLVGILPSLVSTLVGMIPTLMTTGIELFITLAKAVIRALPQITGAILFEVIPALLGAVLSAVPQLLGAGGDLIRGLVDGLWKSAAKVGKALLDIIGDAVDGFLSFLGIHSPSRLFRGFGVNVGEGLAGGIGSMEGDVAAAALGLAHAAADAVDGSSLTLDAGVNVAARTAAALAELGVGEVAPHYETTYNDYSTSQEDKQAKLQRAQLNLERTVAATLGR